MNGAASKITALLVGMVVGAALTLASATLGATRADAVEATRADAVEVIVWPCASDEGEASAQPNLPCAWDSRHRGNGKGHSFLIRKDGQVKRVTHKRAHRLLFGQSAIVKAAECQRPLAGIKDRPCYWDGVHSANWYAGISFYRRANGSAITVSHHRAHCMIRPHVVGSCKR